MPFVSKSEQRYMFATKPTVAAEMAAKTKDFKALPEKVAKPKVHPAVKQGLESFMATHGAAFHRNAGRGFKPKKA